MNEPQAHGGMGRDWDPALYERFAAARRKPFDDLLALLAPLDGGRALDLGCGGGSLTGELQRALGAGETIGVDASEAMLRKARSLALDGVSFVAADLSDPVQTAAGGALDAPFALVFSNAALHLVGDHDAVLARWAALLAPGGQLAFQVPAQHHHPSHQIADRVAAEPAFAAELQGLQRGVPVHTPEQYQARLQALGLSVQCAEYRIYPATLPSPAAVVDWMAGAGLTPYRAQLSADGWSRFLDRYRQLLLAELPDQRPFNYPYRRILVLARR